MTSGTNENMKNQRMESFGALYRGANGSEMVLIGRRRSSLVVATNRWLFASRRNKRRRRVAIGSAVHSACSRRFAGARKGDRRYVPTCP